MICAKKAKRAKMAVMVRRGTLACLLLALSPSIAGCLALAERPINEFGEECTGSKHCPDHGYCEISGDDEVGMCLPNEVECTQRVSPQCNGYSCEVEFGYCLRSCNASADCVDGYECEFEGTSAKGECVVEELPQSECSASDTSACGGYACYEAGFCRTICTSPEDCTTGYRCDDYDCVAL